MSGHDEDDDRDGADRDAVDAVWLARSRGAAPAQQDFAANLVRVLAGHGDGAPSVGW